MATARDLNIDDIVEDMQRLLRTSARMYMCLSQATLDAFGRDGEVAVRFGLRAYGEWRGSEMRQAHHAMGLDIDMKNLIGCWDNASVYIIKDKVASSGTHKPHDVRFDVTFCPAAPAWKEAEFHQWGHVYCDEFHQACVSSYHPDGNVVIPINMMKGDDHCHFQWIMPAGAEALDFGEPTALGMRLAEAYRAETDEDAAWKSLKRSNRLVGGRYVTAARVLIDRYGDRGIEVIREGLRAWGRLRGQVLRREHEKRGWPLDLVTLMHHHDLPYQTVWEVAERVAEPDRFVAEIRYTPQDEAWRDLDATAIGAHWYEPAYEALVDEYMPDAKLRWQKLMCRGDEVNELHIQA